MRAMRVVRSPHNHRIQDCTAPSFSSSSGTAMLCYCRTQRLIAHQKKQSYAFSPYQSAMIHSLSAKSSIGSWGSRQSCGCHQRATSPAPACPSKKYKRDGTEYSTAHSPPSSGALLALYQMLHPPNTISKASHAIRSANLSFPDSKDAQKASISNCFKGCAALARNEAKQLFWAIEVSA